MVVFGRPKGDRGSYLQWREDNLAPQVAFEVLSPGNRAGELLHKFQFYERYGVEEYYLIDPEKSYISGWIRRKGRLEEIGEIDGWVSPRLSIRFELAGDALHIRRPDGLPFLTYAELFQAREEDRKRAKRLAARLRELGVNPDDV